MRCVTWIQGKIVDGIDTVNDDEFGPVILLGEEGRGRRYEKIQFAQYDPAVVEFGRVLFAHPARTRVIRGRGTDNERSVYVLERQRTPVMDSILVRICTRWEHASPARGYWTRLHGSPKEIAKAHGAHGPYGTLGIWDDGLLVMQDHDFIKVMPEGAPRVYPWVLYKLNGRLETMPLSVFETIIQPNEAEAETQHASM